jgi:hypothetical protein
MDYFEQVAVKIQFRVYSWAYRLKNYVCRLLFPLYFFPVKLVTYSLYYLVKFVFWLIFSLVRIVFDTIFYPFKGLRNLLKSIFIMTAVLYMLASLMVIADYLKRNYGNPGKFWCRLGVKTRLSSSVVRIVGGYSEGSGFFISRDQVLTNFHVIANEPSPKIILPTGQVLTPVKIVGNKDADLAMLQTNESFSELVYPLPYEVSLVEDEPLISAGYPLGSDISGRVTMVSGAYIATRKTKGLPVSYLQSDISLVPGMSGGPLVDQCGELVGINTQGLAGLSLFITGVDARTLLPGFTDQEIKKIEVDASKSPDQAVRAFYTYLKARRMEDGFELLSSSYLNYTNFQEWTSRFSNILDVNIYKSEMVEKSKDTVFVKFSTKNWVDGEVEMHFYEGAWQTVQEDGEYKMNRSKIIEISEPDWRWFYD